MNPSDNKVFRRNRSITSIGLIYKNWGFYLEFLWLCEELVGVTHRRWLVLFPVGDIIDRDIICTAGTAGRRSWSPRSSIWRGKHGSSLIGTIIHCTSREGQEFTVSVSDTYEIGCCTRWSFVPRCSIWWGENFTWWSHCNIYTVSIGDIIDRDIICTAGTAGRRSWSPRSSICRGEHGSSLIGTIVHCTSQGQEFTVSVSDTNEIGCCTRWSIIPRDSIRWGQDGSWWSNCNIRWKHLKRSYC